MVGSPSWMEDVLSAVGEGEENCTRREGMGHVRDTSSALSLTSEGWACGLGLGMNPYFFPPKKLKSDGRRFWSLEHFSFSAFNNSFIREKQTRLLSSYCWVGSFYILKVFINVRNILWSWKPGFPSLQTILPGPECTWARTVSGLQGYGIQLYQKTMTSRDYYTLRPQIYLWIMEQLLKTTCEGQLPPV